MLRNKKKGFTLIELVIVVAIIGILVALAVPRFTSATEAAKNRAIESNARTIASAITTSFATTTKWPVATSTGSGAGNPETFAQVLAKSGLSTADQAKYQILKAEAAGIEIKYLGTDYTGTVADTNKVFKF